MPIPCLIAPSSEDVGIDPAALQRLFDRAAEEVAQSRIESCQLAVARHGRLAGMATFGATPDGRAATNETLFAMFSAVKPISAAAIWKLLEQGALTLDQPAADVIPEFATNGKDAVTLRQVLTFTAGFPGANAFALVSGEGLEGRREHETLLSTSAGRCAAFATWSLDWAPGTAYAYHSEGAHWLLAEIIARVTGGDYRDYVRSAILDPMGLDTFFLGCPVDEQHRYHFADVVLQGADAAPEVYGDLAPLWNTPEIRSLGNPSGGGFATAADLALFYQPLLNDGLVNEGAVVLQPETIRMATRPWTDERHFELLSEMPRIILPTLRGLGIELAGDDDVILPEGMAETDGIHGMAAISGGMTGTVPARTLRGCFGSSNSAAAFGHNGAGGQVGWADPQTGISFAFLTNTFSMPRKGRIIELSTLANECVRAERG